MIVDFKRVSELFKNSQVVEVTEYFDYYAKAWIKSSLEEEENVRDQVMRISQLGATSLNLKIRCSDGTTELADYTMQEITHVDQNIWIERSRQLKRPEIPQQKIRGPKL